MDQPFRTYSSGMQARLTFAVATSVDADIILIDEALSVGDARFQLKSFDRIRDFKRRGKTILLVSHDINAICSICDRAVLLERGRVHAEGDPARVGNIYHELLFGPRALTAASEAPVAAGREAAPVDAEHRYGLRTARIDRVEITKSALPAGTLRSLETYAMEFTIRASEATGPLHFGFLIRTPRAMTVCGWDTGSAGLPPLPPFAPGEVRVARVSFRANMAPGRYFLTAALARPDRTKEDVRFDALELTVEGAGGLHADSIVDLEVERPVVSLVSRSAERRKEA
jgi:lipopolysaccharide transport system ATP-binding protein